MKPLLLSSRSTSKQSFSHASVFDSDCVECPHSLTLLRFLYPALPSRLRGVSASSTKSLQMFHPTWLYFLIQSSWENESFAVTWSRGPNSYSTAYWLCDLTHKLLSLSEVSFCKMGIMIARSSHNFWTTKLSTALKHLKYLKCNRCSLNSNFAELLRISTMRFSTSFLCISFIHAGRLLASYGKR